jgi:hypothetical protein
MKLTDLTGLRQRNDETVSAFIQRFREVKNKCYSLVLSDQQLADVAFQGLLPHIREKYASQEFEQQKALDRIKQYLTNPLVLVPPQKHKPYKLYLSADERAIGSTLIQEFEGKERVIYYVSRRLLDAETRYPPVERLCLCLYFSCTKLRHYLLSTECTVVSKKNKQIVKSESLSAGFFPNVSRSVIGAFRQYRTT